MVKLSKEQRRNKKKKLQRRAKEQARQSLVEHFGIMLERLCSASLPEYVDDSQRPDLVGRKILWQMGMIAWNIVVTDREELADGAFAGTKLNDEQQGMVRREIDELVGRMRNLYPCVGRTIMAVSVIMKNGKLCAKVQLGDEFPGRLVSASEKSSAVVATGSEILALRKRLAMTQVSFGEKIGVPARKVSAWEHDRSRPNEIEAAKIRGVASAVKDHKGSQ